MVDVVGTLSGSVVTPQIVMDSEIATAQKPAAKKFRMDINAGKIGAKMSGIPVSLRSALPDYSGEGGIA